MGKSDGTTPRGRYHVPMWFKFRQNRHDYFVGALACFGLLALCHFMTNGRLQHWGDVVFIAVVTAVGVVLFIRALRSI